MNLFFVILMSLLTPSCAKWVNMTRKDIKEGCMYMYGDDLELLNCNSTTFYAKPEDDRFAFNISDCGKGFAIYFGKPIVSFRETDMTNMVSLNFVMSVDGTVSANGKFHQKLGTITPGNDCVVEIHVNPGGSDTLPLVKGDAMVESSAPGAISTNTKLALIIVGALVGVILLGASVFFIHKYYLKKKDDVKTVVKCEDKDGEKEPEDAAKASKRVDVKSKAGTASTQTRKKPSLKRTTSQTNTGTEAVEDAAVPAKETGGSEVDVVTKKDCVEEKKVGLTTQDVVETKDVAPAVTPPVVQITGLTTQDVVETKNVAPAVTPPVVQITPVQLQNVSAATTSGTTKSNVSVTTTPVAAHQNEAAHQNNALSPKPDVSPVQACPPENKNIAAIVPPPVVIVPTPVPKSVAPQIQNVVPTVQPTVVTTPVNTTKDVVTKPHPVVVSPAHAPIVNVRPVVKPTPPAARKNVAAPQIVTTKVQVRVKPVKNVPAKAATSEEPSLEAHCIDTTDDHPIKNNGTEELTTIDDHCIDPVEDHPTKNDMVPATTPPPSEEKANSPALSTEGNADDKETSDISPIPAALNKFSIAYQAVKLAYPQLPEDELEACAKIWEKQFEKPGMVLLTAPRYSAKKTGE